MGLNEGSPLKSCSRKPVFYQNISKTLFREDVHVFELPEVMSIAGFVSE